MSSRHPVQDHRHQPRVFDAFAIAGQVVRGDRQPHELSPPDSFARRMKLLEELFHLRGEQFCHGGTEDSWKLGPQEVRQRMMERLTGRGGKDFGVGRGGGSHRVTPFFAGETGCLADAVGFARRTISAMRRCAAPLAAAFAKR